MPDNSPAKVSARATGVVAIAVMCSRVLGLIREQVFEGLFGAGRSLDAFLMAFRVPNLLRDLFAEGALSTAFITTFSGKIATEGDESAWRLANKVATLTVVFMSAVTLFGMLVALRYAPFGRAPTSVGLAVAIWVALFKSGIDPVIAGLAIGLATSAYPPSREDLERATALTREFREQPTPELARSAQQSLQSAISPNAMADR